jgi:hypothetical protein
MLGRWNMANRRMVLYLRSEIYFLCGALRSEVSF